MAHKGIHIVDPTPQSTALCLCGRSELYEFEDAVSVLCPDKATCVACKAIHAELKLAVVAGYISSYAAPTEI
jgi:hypothetical protein